MKRKLISVLGVAFILIITGCGFKKKPSYPPEYYTTRYFRLSVDGGDVAELELTDEQWETYSNCFNSVVSEKQLLIRDMNIAEEHSYSIDAYRSAENDLDYQELSIRRSSNGYERYLATTNGFYPENSALDLFVSELARENGLNVKTASPEERLLNCRYSCAEPTTEAEYIEAARNTASQWLSSLKNESEYYNLSGYRFIDENHPYYEGRVFHGSGDINGGKEFAVCLYFSPENNVMGNNIFLPEGQENTRFYTSDYGSALYARYRWENGVCSIIDYTDCDEVTNSIGVAYNLTNGSVDEHIYPTFFEFLADKEYYDEVSGICSPHDKKMEFTFSHNIITMPDSSVLYFDIGCPWDEYETLPDGRAYTAMWQVFYTNDSDIYNSPVDYNSQERTYNRISFNQNFKVVFDDYNCDSYPDYAIKINENELGGFYDVRYINSMGMPIGDNDDVLIAGHFEDSLRIQLLEPNVMIKPEYNDGVLQYIGEVIQWDPYGENPTNFPTIDDYRMYSQRFYMPENVRCYETGTREITFNLWNNTSEAVTAGGNYTIECLSNGEWSEVGSGSCNTVTIEGNCGIELVLDVSSVKQGAAHEYRIVMNINGQTVCGGFYMGSEVSAEISVSGGGTLPDGRVQLDFILKNDGGLNVKLTDCKLYKDDSLVYTIDENELCDIERRSETTVSITDKMIGEKFSSGVYKLVAAVEDKEFSATTTLVSVAENERYFFTAEEAVLTDDKLQLTISCNKWNGETLNGQIKVDGVWVLRDNKWLTSDCYPDNSIIRDGSFSLKKGDKLTAGFSSQRELLQSQYDFMLAAYEQSYKNGTVTHEEYEKNTAKNINDLFGTLRKGDLCYVVIRNAPDRQSERVFFTIQN